MVCGPLYHLDDLMKKLFMREVKILERGRIPLF